MTRLLRLSKIDETPGMPIRKSTAYKWHHIGRFPQLFVKIGGCVCLNLDKLDEFISNGGTRRK
jgi:hypothetical protein